MKLRMKNRDEIVNAVKIWIAEGKLISKVSLGIPYHEIDKKVAEGTYFATSAQGILCTDAETRKEFEELWDKKRIMDGLRIGVVLGYVTQYGISKACAEGKVARVDLDGKKSILYVV